MADADTVWVMYTADYDTGRQHSHIIPDSVRILRTSTREIGSGELQAERERAGLNSRLHTIRIAVPPEVTGENVAAYAERFISLEPGFDFWDDVIGDDIVVAGIAYGGDRYAPDGEGGVGALTEAEHAAREATVRQREAEREAEQTAREAQRRQQAIDYAMTSATRQDASVADNAIGLFMQYQASGMDTADAQREATVEAAWDHAVAARSNEPPGAYLPGTVPALPALGGLRIAENAIEEFMSLRQSGLEPGAARELAVKRAGTPEPEHRPAHNPEAELELDQPWLMRRTTCATPTGQPATEPQLKHSRVETAKPATTTRSGRTPDGTQPHHWLLACGSGRYIFTPSSTTTQPRPGRPIPPHLTGTTPMPICPPRQRPALTTSERLRPIVPTWARRRSDRPHPPRQITILLRRSHESPK